jgi:Tfp pilus assembly protein PilE
MGLIGGIARTAVIAGTATAVSNRVSRRQANRWAAQDQQQQEQAYASQQEYAPQQDAAPSSASNDSLAQLQQLGQLRDSGVLTEAEFQVQKERILAG